jgi:hypothetical protein
MRRRRTTIWQRIQNIHTKDNKILNVRKERGSLGMRLSLRYMYMS